MAAAERGRRYNLLRAYMRVTDDRLIISEAIAIQWDAIQTLKVLEKKLLVTLEGGVAVELAGLHPREVDAAFVAYSRYLTAK